MERGRTVIDSLKSEAVVLYTSRGRSPFPLGDPDAVRALAGGAREDLVRYVEDLVTEMFEAYPLSAADRDPVKAEEMVEVGMAARHPELNSEASRALAWMWSYSAWK